MFADDVAMFKLALILLRSVESKVRVTTVITALVLELPPWRAIKEDVFAALSRILKLLKMKDLAIGSSKVMISWPASRSKSKLTSIGDVVSPVKLEA